MTRTSIPLTGKRSCPDSEGTLAAGSQRYFILAGYLFQSAPSNLTVTSRKWFSA